MLHPKITLLYCTCVVLADRFASAMKAQYVTLYFPNLFSGHAWLYECPSRWPFPDNTSQRKSCRPGSSDFFRKFESPHFFNCSSPDIWLLLQYLYFSMSIIQLFVQWLSLHWIFEQKLWTVSTTSVWTRKVHLSTNNLGKEIIFLRCWHWHW